MTGKYYRHYKGGFYQLLCIGKNEADGVPHVVYQSLRDAQIWIRPASAFFGKVQPQGYPKPIPRFFRLEDDPREKKETPHGEGNTATPGEENRQGGSGPEVPVPGS